MTAPRGALAILLVAALVACGRDGYFPSKDEIMVATQVRHTKLGLAGRSENWALVEFELHELDEGFEDFAEYHPELAERLERHVSAPIRELRAVTARRDAAGFAIAYDSLTTSCNECHAESGFAAIAIVRPEASPFPDQDFAPRR